MILTCAAPFSESPENNSGLLALLLTTKSLSVPPWGTDASKRCRITEGSSTGITLDQSARSISAATDRRRFCQVSKTRPRRPQAPPSVRRHPRKAIAIRDFRFFIARSYALSRHPLLVSSGELLRFLVRPFLHKMLYKIIARHPDHLLDLASKIIQTWTPSLNQLNRFVQATPHARGALPTPPNFFKWHPPRARL